MEQEISKEAVDQMNAWYNSLPPEAQKSVQEAVELQKANAKNPMDETKVEVILDTFAPEKVAPFKPKNSTSAQDHINAKKDERVYFEEKRRALEAQKEAEIAEEQVIAHRAVAASEKGRQLAIETEYKKKQSLFAQVKAKLYGFAAKADQAEAISATAQAQTATALKLCESIKQSQPLDINEALLLMQNVNSIAAKQQKTQLKALGTTISKILPKLGFSKEEL